MAEIDWAKIELDYRAGVKSLRQIGSEQGVSEGAIRKRSKRDDWTRDLSERIQDKADQLVRKEAVRSTVRTEADLATERQIVDANAQAIADVQLNHRRAIKRANTIVNKLFDELEHQTGIEQAELLAELGEIMRKEDEKGQDRLNDLYHKIISLPNRVKSAKDLSDTLKNLIALEREAFGMDKEQAKTSDPLSDLIALINGTTQGTALKPVIDDPEHAK